MLHQILFQLPFRDSYQKNYYIVINEEVFQLPFRDSEVSKRPLQQLLSISFNSLSGILEGNLTANGSALAGFQLPFRDSLEMQRSMERGEEAFNSLSGIPHLPASWEPQEGCFQLPFRDSVDLILELQLRLVELSTPFPGFRVVKIFNGSKRRIRLSTPFPGF